MMEKDDNLRKVEEIDAVFKEQGLTLVEYIRISGGYRSSTLQLGDEDKCRFCQLYDEISSDKLNTQQKGYKLEELFSLLFSNASGSFFECRRNCRTSSNEIDLLLSWNEEARLMRINEVFPCFGETFLCECKNFDQKVSVTYVGKFYSLLASVGAKLGILVAWNGITGRGEWDSAKGLIKKIALKEGVYIISLDKEDLKRIYQGDYHIYALIYDKYNAIKNDIDFNKYISKHRAEDLL